MTIEIKNPHGLVFNVETLCANRNAVKVSLKEYPNKIVDVPMSLDSFVARWALWRTCDQTVDAAFHDMPITIRDFFQMGVHPTEWAEMFSGTDIAEQHRDSPEYEEYVRTFPLNDPRD